MSSEIEKRWNIDVNDRIGSGGFGSVYSAVGSDGRAAAAKYVPKTETANRDLLAVQVPESAHIVPVLDVGETDEHWVLIMPRADHSLRDVLNSGSEMNQSEALNILTSVARGLAVLDGVLVHRDLKPENVLYLDGSWAICDFGIARYAEASTAADTKKYSMTGPYAAPEQWRVDHATGATDIYAFGVIAYELLTGSRPFLGPTREDFRTQHLHSTPPSPPTTRRLKSLIVECLDKAAEARPRPQNLVARLERAEEESRRPGASSLAGANQVAVEARSAESRKAEIARTESERRAALFASAQASYSRIFDDLIEVVEEEAPTAQIRRDSGGVHVRLGSGSLDLASSRAAGSTDGPYDVIAFGSISIAQSAGRAVKRSHSLYFCDFDEARSYAWYELAFTATMHADFANSPHALDPSKGLYALTPVLGVYQLGRPIRRLDLGDLDADLDRWIDYFGKAAQGTLTSPSQLPEGNPKYPRR